jgi:hypothetical protein
VCVPILTFQYVIREEVIELFLFVDIDSSKIIELKEFLVALTCGYVLESIPTFRSINQSAETGSEVAASSSSAAAVAPDPASHEGAGEEAGELKKMLNLIAFAYLLFDPECDGVINKKSLERLVEEGGVKVHKNKELSEHLWKLMVCMLTNIYLNVNGVIHDNHLSLYLQDCDANGQIDFPEFVHTFSDWIDVEGEEDEEEDAGHA